MSRNQAFPNCVPEKRPMPAFAGVWLGQAKNWLSTAPLGRMCPFSITEQSMAGKSHKTPGFEAAMAELEQIVADMESGKLSLEDSLSSYKRGAELLAFCRSRLEDAQQQVRVLEDGMLKEFSAEGGRTEL